MSAIFNEILKNLEYVYVVIALLFVFQLSNMLFGIADNVGVKKQKFDIEKIKGWALRAALELSGLFFLVVGVSLIPYAIGLSGAVLSPENDNLITIVMILAVSIKSMTKEAKKAYEHYVNISNR